MSIARLPTPDFTPRAASVAGPAPLDPHCVACGYNLRGLAVGPSVSCPECGAAADLRPVARPLVEADAAWLRRLGWGSRVLVAGLVVSLPLPYLGVPVALVGLWALLTPEPAVREGRGAAERRAGRGFAAAGALGLLAFTGVVARSLGTDALTLYGKGIAYDAVALSPHAAAIAAALLAWPRLAALAGRMPDAALAHDLLRLRGQWVLAVAGVLLLAIIAVATDGIRFDPPTREEAMLPLALLAATLGLAGWLWLATFRAARRLSARLAALARESL